MRVRECTLGRHASLDTAAPRPARLRARPRRLRRRRRPDVAEVLRQTFGEDKDIKSGRLDVSARLDAQGLAQLQGPVSLRLAGPFVSTKPDELPRFDFEGELDAGGQTLRAGATSTGEKGFISFQGQAYALTEELYAELKKGYAEENAQNKGEDDEGISFKSLGVDPQRWLRDPKYVGKEQVGGAETFHIRSGIDVPRLLDDLNRVLARAEQVQGQRARQLTEQERQQIAEAVGDARMEVWTGEEDKILRRINVRLRFEVPEAAQQQAQGLTGGTLRFDLAFGAINEEQEIREPEGAKPLAELTGGQAGGAGGAAGGGAQGGGGTAQTPYERCVEAAGTDVRELQKCAAG
jgi:hypothetical protein